MIKNIKENGNVRPSDIMSIVDNFWRNRTRFSAKISFLQMIFHGFEGRIFRTFCCFCCSAFRYKKNRRLDNLVRNAENRYNHEIDIVNIVNTVRRLRTAYMASNLPYQRILFQLQRDQIIESTTEDDSSTEMMKEVKENIYKVQRKETSETGLGYMACTLRNVSKEN